MSSVTWDDHRPFPIDHDGPVDRPFDPIDQAWQERSILDRFEHICARFPDRIAIDDGVLQLSYAQLRSTAYALAAQISELAPADQPIAAVIPGNAVYPAALIACLALGRILTPIDVTHPFARKAAILEETQPGFVLLAAGTDPEPGLIPEGLPRLAIDLSQPTGSPPQPQPVSPDSLIGIAFTSGSTGRPKGLAYRQDGTLVFVAEYVNALHINEDDVILALGSLGAGGNMSIMAAILTGARVRMLDIKAAGIDGVLKVLHDDQITILSMIPLVFRALFKAPGANEAVRSLRAITSGGDRLLGADVALFRSVLPPGCHIRATQGSTETTVVFNWFIPEGAVFDDQATVPSGYLGEGKSVGMITAEPDAAGVIEAEFLVRGAHLAAGGWQAGRLTPGPFVADPGDPSRKIFDTGDVVRRLPSGLYEFIGRRDRMIKILGLRADPADVEAILRKTPGVGEVVVIPRRTGDEAVFVAFVAPIDLRAPPSGADLQAAVAEEAPAHMVPAEVRLLPSIPRLPNYKPDFVALDALDKAGRVDRPAPARAPASDADPIVVAAVRKAWFGTLGEASFAEDRPWNRSGGDSLKALQLMLRLEEHLGRKVPLELFDAALAPSGFIRKLSAFMAGDLPDPSQGKPLVILCPGVGGDDTALATFRAAQLDVMQFETIEYPGFDRSIADLKNPETLLSSALDQIERRCPTGPIRLAGYSLGGVVAFEMATRLKARGRTIERLCVIDTDASVRGAERYELPKSSLLQKIAWVRSNARSFGWNAAIQEIFLNRLLRHKRFGLLKWLIQLRNKEPGHRSVYAHQRLVELLHGHAFVSWRPQPYAGELWLLRADERKIADAPDDLSWTPLVDKLHVLRVTGSHHSMFSGPNLPVACAAFANAMDIAGAQAGHEPQQASA